MRNITKIGKDELANVESGLRQGSESERGFYNELLRRSWIEGEVGSWAIGAVTAAATLMMMDSALGILVGAVAGSLAMEASLPAFRDHYKEYYLRKLVRTGDGE